MNQEAVCLKNVAPMRIEQLALTVPEELVNQ